MLFLGGLQVFFRQVTRVSRQWLLEGALPHHIDSLAILNALGHLYRTLSDVVELSCVQKGLIGRLSHTLQVGVVLLNPCCLLLFEGAEASSFCLQLILDLGDVL